MGLTAGKFNLNPGQFLGGGTSSTDPTERTAPLSRYGTHHPIDKALWKVDRGKEIVGKIKGTKKAPGEVLASVSAAQGRGGK